MYKYVLIQWIWFWSQIHLNTTQYTYIRIMCVWNLSIYVGNTGSYLIDTGFVYITSDGGLSWEQVSKFNDKFYHKHFMISLYMHTYIHVCMLLISWYQELMNCRKSIKLYSMTIQITSQCLNFIDIVCESVAISVKHHAK